MRSSIRLATTLLLGAASALPAHAQTPEAAPVAGDDAPSAPLEVAQAPEVSASPSDAPAETSSPADTSAPAPASTDAALAPQGMSAEPAAQAAPMVTPAPAPPPALAPVPTSTWTPVYTGSFFTRYEARTGYDELGVERAPRFLEGDAVFYRLRFGIGTGLIETGSRVRAGVFFVPQASGVFGVLPSTTTDAALGLHEGYARVQGRYVRADFGRFELNYGDALIIGNLDWNETGRSFDGMRARVAASERSAWVDVFGTVVDEGRPDLRRGERFGDGDLYFAGVYAGFGPAITQGFDLDAYALVRAWPETDDIPLDPASATTTSYDRRAAGEATFGVRTKRNFGLIDLRFESGVQTGSRPDAAPKAGTMPAPAKQNVRDVFAYHADLEVGLNVVRNKLRVAAEGLIASGDDAETDRNEGWDELYPTAHKWLGLSDAFAQRGIKRTNVASGVFHATTTLMEGLTMQADGHLFARLERGDTPRGVAAVEVDVGLSYRLVKGLTLRGVYALFLPNETIYAQTPADDADAAQFGEVELRYDL